MLLPREFSLSFGQLREQRFAAPPKWLYIPFFVCLQQTFLQRLKKQHQCCKTRIELKFIFNQSNHKKYKYKLDKSGTGQTVKWVEVWEKLILDAHNLVNHFTQRFRLLL